MFARVGVCVCMCKHMRVGARARRRVHACARLLPCYPACNTYAPYCDVIFGLSDSTKFFDII